VPQTAPVSEVLNRIRAKRAQIERFLARAQPRKRRLLNTTIVGGTLAAALTAGPAVGGQTFTAWLTQIAGLQSPSWRLLCAGAAISSLLAAVATQMLKSTHLEEHVARAQTCRARLEVLDVALLMQHIDVSQATGEYLKCVEDAALLGL
jgi:MFS family permease